MRTYIHRQIDVCSCWHLIQYSTRAISLALMCAVSNSKVEYVWPRFDIRMLPHPPLSSKSLPESEAPIREYLNILKNADNNHYLL